MGDPVLGDDDLLLVQHGGEQLDLPVQHAAQPLAFDRDRGQQPVQFPGVREVAEPAAENLAQDCVSMRWSRVRIRVSLGARIFRRNGWRFPPKSARTF